MKKKVIIIGSGLGSLSAALYLNRYGYDVHVYEKNEGPGGKAGEFKKEGFRFDTGPSLLTMEFVLRNVFTENGIKESEIPRLEPLAEVCRYFFPDGSKFQAFSDYEKFEKEVTSQWGEDPMKLRDYFKYVENIYELSKDLFLFNDFQEWDTLRKYADWRYLFKLNQLDFFRTMVQSVKGFFKNEKTHQFFSRYATYNGSNPFLAPATLNIISHVEHSFGAYLPEKGMHSVADALYRAALKRKVAFHFNEEVLEILTEKENLFAGKKKTKVNGIRTSKSSIYGDYVISNADVYSTYEYLLKDTKSAPAKKYKKLEPSSSALIFFWGMDREFPDLDVHNIFFSKNYQMEFDTMFNQRSFADDLTVYIYISSKKVAGDAPAGKENWFVMVNAPSDDGAINWDHAIKKVRRNILKKISTSLKIPIEKNILFEKVYDPQEIEKRTSSKGGSLYGISSNSKRAAFLRQSNRSRLYRNLFFTGGSAHPGGGIPLVLLSGRITAKRIMKLDGRKNDLP